MSARSVAELLPRPFDELELVDVETILANAGDAGESMFLEWKSALGPEHLAKAAAAFANTLGGLLIGGVDDATRQIVGMEPPGGEVELWVKDQLRSRLLPSPPFRARALHLAGGRIALLVLVPESSTTPHLLTRRGAIYVRNPGSSDPVPIRDQALLLDLVNRGREARRLAELRSEDFIRFANAGPGRVIYSMALVPTGVQTDVVHDLHVANRAEAALRPATEIFQEPGANEYPRLVEWALNEVGTQRVVARGRGFSEPGAVLDGVSVASDCAVCLRRAWLSNVHGDPGEVEPRGLGPLRLDGESDAIMPWLAAALAKGRDLILELGGHGDLAVRIRVATAGRTIFWAPNRAESAIDDFNVFHWSTLDDDDDDILRLVRAQLHRMLGIAWTDQLHGFESR